VENYAVAYIVWFAREKIQDVVVSPTSCRFPANLPRTAEGIRKPIPQVGKGLCDSIVAGSRLTRFSNPQAGALEVFNLREMWTRWGKKVWDVNEKSADGGVALPVGRHQNHPADSIY
jgi:hypothetical protein